MLRRKLMINLAVILFCGTVAISVPIIVNHLQDTVFASNQTETQTTLVCEFVGNKYQDNVDSLVIWQIYQKRGNTIVTTWDEILTSNELTYSDQTHLILTPYGLCYDGIITKDDYQTLYNTNYQSYVTYQGQTCCLTLPKLPVAS